MRSHATIGIYFSFRLVWFCGSRYFRSLSLHCFLLHLLILYSSAFRVDDHQQSSIYVMVVKPVLLYLILLPFPFSLSPVLSAFFNRLTLPFDTVPISPIAMNMHSMSMSVPLQCRVSLSVASFSHSTLVTPWKRIIMFMQTVILPGQDALLWIKHNYSCQWFFFSLPHKCNEKKRSCMKIVIALLPQL